MSEHDGFRVESDADRGVATITLDVPGKFNRVSMNARDELRGVFEELDRDDAVRFVVLAGAGRRSPPEATFRGSWHGRRGTSRASPTTSPHRNVAPSR